jgi:indole-3-glycerol phosphate synthase
MNILETIKKGVYKRLPKQVFLSKTICRINFLGILEKPGCSIIAEIKFASPSQGKIYHGKLTVVEIARSYLSKGASALSIVTEPDFFQGDIQSVIKVRSAFPEVAILLKDFIFEKVQLEQAVSLGANSVVLIVACLSTNKLKSLYNYCCALGLVPIVEIHNKVELESALKLNPKVIGINNRNLKTMRIDVEISITLIKSIPKSIHVIFESGIQSSLQLERMKKYGFSGFLIGSSLMRQQDPGQALNNLLNGSCYAG